MNKRLDRARFDPGCVDQLQLRKGLRMRIPTWLRGFQRTIGACFLAAILTSHA